MRLKFASVLLGLGLLLSFVAPVHAADECGFGQSSDSPDFVERDDGYYTIDGVKIPNLVNWLDETEVCAPSKWRLDNRNDGFSKSISLVMYPDDEHPENQGNSSIEIFCTKKKISVYVWVEYADSIGWSGTGQVKFDSGKVNRFSYFLQKDFDGVVLKDSKSFMKSLVSAKNRFAFKIPHVDGYETLVYPKGDIVKHRRTFAKSGCKF